MFSSAIWIYLGVAVFFTYVLIVSLKTNRQQSSDKTKFTYKVKKSLFSPAERSFLGVLHRLLNDNYEVLGKVRISDVLSPDNANNKKDWWSSFNKISSKYFDYVICNKKDLSFVAVIELDDASHNRASRIERDDFVNSACQSANLKLLRFKAARGYKLSEVAQILGDNGLAVGDFSEVYAPRSEQEAV
ncbi:DUF2726 domain-containing protein [Veronia pacifica]|uniref:DUF2726 domain-containing protein n=1 Tax=Veronia pacifica TaxID=1080227 RepID=A0A1C3EEQ1_9GAMM|nr:DUF2726 domain-containing protein [Veronia pacifica]ODA31737.1 hypothetical protein A8L45_15265 [Veronia pacifica]